MYAAINTMKKLWLFLGILFIVFPASSQSKVDSLLRLCEKATEKQKPGYYLELSFNTRQDSAKSNSYARLAYKLAVKNKQIREQAKAFYYLGETAYFSNDFAGAIPHYEKALPIYEQLRDSFLLTNCYSSIGLSYHFMTQGAKAIPYFIKALKLRENDKEYTAEILANIALVHARMHNDKYAISYYRKAVILNKAIKDFVSLAVDYNGIGDSFLSMHQTDSSLVYYLKAHSLFRKIHKAGYEAIALANLGIVYTNYPDSLDKATNAFNQALVKFQKLGLNQYEADIKEGIGNVLKKHGEYKEAIKAFNESLLLADKYNRGFVIKTSNYKDISETYEKAGDYKSALKYHILYAQYNDSLVQKEKYQQIINLEKQYDSEKKENEIIKLQAKQELTDVQLRKDKQFRQLGFITVALLLGFLLFILYKYFDKLKSNQLLEEKNKLIKQSEHELRVLNAAKNKFFSIIAHDLKNPLHAILGYSYLLTTDYDRFTEPERRKFAQDIHHSTNNIFRLLQNLLEWSRSQTGSLTFTPLEIEFKRILGNSINVLYSVAEQKSITINLDYNEELKMFADPLMIETVLRNLINNAIKFTPENGLIDITAKQNGNEVEICVRDNGIGISESDCINLFRIDSKVKRKGTNEEDGSGIGLILCKEFVDRNNGTIWVESETGKGSSFFFTIPAKAIA